MTHLATYRVDAPASPIATSEAPEEIAAMLAPAGIRFERWPIRPLAAGADDRAVLALYAGEIAALKAAHGYRTVDIVRMTPDHDDRDALRRKFLSEHRHAEDEVRFFVEGRGLFSLRDDMVVHVLRCEAGDLIGVPAGIRHWFDMGPSPRFAAIRLFTDPAGWVAQYSGDPIADAFPRLA